MSLTDRDQNSTLVFAVSAGHVVDQIRAGDFTALREPSASDTYIGTGTDATTGSLPEQVRQDLLEDGHATLIGVVPPNPALYGVADMADEGLMAAVTGGSHDAFEQLYDRHVRNCFGLALKIVRDPLVAEDITQEVFMKIWSRPQAFLAQRGKFKPWLLTVVHHRSIDKVRTMRLDATHSIVPLDTGNPAIGVARIDAIPDVSPSPYESAWTNETGRLVHDALRQLPERQHEVVVLAYFEGLTQNEIATTLNKPLGTVKTRTRSALRSLHELFITEGLLSIE